MPEIDFKNFEKHMQTGIVMAITALLIWVGHSVNQTNIGQAVLENKIDTLERTVNNMNRQSYTANEAARDARYIELEFDNLKRRVNYLEDKLNIQNPMARSKK